MAINTSNLICNVKGHQDLSYSLYNGAPTIMITCRECGEIFVAEDASHIDEIAPYFNKDIFRRLKERMELW